MLQRQARLLDAFVVAADADVVDRTTISTEHTVVTALVTRLLLRIKLTYLMISTATLKYTR
jgi:hypothetical protein